MAISLSKGAKVDLTKGNPGLDSIVIGLGWDVNKYDGGKEFDLDTSVFLLNAEGKVTGDKDFVFYGNKQHESGSVTHSGDNLTGTGDGDDETIDVVLSTVPANIDKISVAITIHDADTRNQNFGQVSNAYVRVINKATGEELIKYDLGEDYSVQTAVVACQLYRHNGEWKFNAVGEGYQAGLEGLCTDFGLQIS